MSYISIFHLKVTHSEIPEGTLTAFLGFLLLFWAMQPVSFILMLPSYFLGNFILAFNALPSEIFKCATYKQSIALRTWSRTGWIALHLWLVWEYLTVGSALHNSHCLNWKWDWRMTHAFPHPTPAMNLWPSSFLSGPIFSVRRNNDKKGTDLVRHCSLTLQTAHIRQGREGLRSVVPDLWVLLFHLSDLGRRLLVWTGQEMVSYSWTVWGWIGHLATSLALKWNQLSFGMRNEDFVICTRFLDKGFSHLVLGKNPGPKEATKYLPAILATWFNTQDWP